PSRVAAFAAEVAGMLGDRESVPLLRPRLIGDIAGDIAVATSAAEALATLAPANLACDLIALLAQSAPEALVMVPTTLLSLAEQGEPVRSEARACLAQAIATADPARESAIWVAAALADGRFAAGFRAALTADAPTVRRAAAWALGEMPSEP